MRRALLLYNVLALLVAQQTTPSMEGDLVTLAGLAESPAPPFVMLPSGASRVEIFVAAVQEGKTMRMVLVLHSRETELETEADIQIWPSGRVKLKHPENLDRASLDFWLGLMLMPGVKKELCR